MYRWSFGCWVSNPTISRALHSYQHLDNHQLSSSYSYSCLEHPAWNSLRLLMHWRETRPKAQEGNREAVILQLSHPLSRRSSLFLFSSLSPSLAFSSSLYPFGWKYENPVRSCLRDDERRTEKGMSLCKLLRIPLMLLKRSLWLR